MLDAITTVFARRHRLEDKEPQLLWQVPWPGGGLEKATKPKCLSRSNCPTNGVNVETSGKEAATRTGGIEHLVSKVPDSDKSDT